MMESTKQTPTSIVGNVTNTNESNPMSESKRRLRILHSVGHLLRGGIEMWLYQMVKRLDPARFEHHVIVRTDVEESFTEDFRKAGVRVLPCLNFKNPIHYVMNLKNLVRANGPFDILHIHGSNPNGLQAGLIAKHLGIPRTIIHSHNDVRPLLQANDLLYGAYVRLTLKGMRFAADIGIAASGLAAESMFGTAWEQDPRWQLLYYGIDFKPFAEPPLSDMRKKLGIPEHAFVIGHVGRFHEQKNHAFLVEIAREAVRKDDKTHFLLIGDGELRAQVAGDFQQHGLADHVTFVPDTQKVPQIMVSVMDAFLFPSRYEGLGLVAVEAQAAGLPCFLSDRVPTEAIVDPKLVRILGLKEPPNVWSDAILTKDIRKIIDLTGHLSMFESSKFSLEKSTTKLAGIYLGIASPENG